MKRAVVALVAMAVLAAVMPAQAPQQPPKPGPEQKRIGYFVGKWTSAGEMKESPFGPAGKYSVTEQNEWLPGGFFLVMHSDFKGAMGEEKGLAVMGFNPEEKMYTYDAFNSMGMAESAKGTVKGDTWSWTSESKVGGKPIKTRYGIKELSPTAYTFKLESSPDGKAWSTIMEGKVTKAK